VGGFGGAVVSSGWGHPSGCCCCINIQSFYMTAGWLKMCNSEKRGGGGVVGWLGGWEVGGLEVGGDEWV